MAGSSPATTASADSDSPGNSSSSASHCPPGSGPAPGPAPGPVPRPVPGPVAGPGQGPGRGATAARRAAPDSMAAAREPRATRAASLTDTPAPGTPADDAISTRAGCRSRLRHRAGPPAWTMAGTDASAAYLARDA